MPVYESRDFMEGQSRNFMEEDPYPSYVSGLGQDTQSSLLDATEDRGLMGDRVEDRRLVDPSQQQPPPPQPQDQSLQLQQHVQRSLPPQPPQQRPPPLPQHHNPQASSLDLTSDALNHVLPPLPPLTTATPGYSTHDISPALSTPTEQEPTKGFTRVKPIQKPQRDIMKHSDGRYYCTFLGCTEALNGFSRKCEWNKHMDKHERPYRCQHPGCENLLGFTYSGGLLRHEREVHGRHGGPKKTVNCPHPTCKRHTGKGFSRQENLNEHLRRVHTVGGNTLGEDGQSHHLYSDNESEANGPRGKKRKTRESSIDDVRDLYIEVQRLRQENDDIRRNFELRQQALMAQIAELQGALRLNNANLTTASNPVA